MDEDKAENPTHGDRLRLAYRQPRSDFHELHCFTNRFTVRDIELCYLTCILNQGALLNSLRGIDGLL